MDRPRRILAAVALALAASTGWAQHSGAHDYVGISSIDPADDSRHAARPLYDRLGGAAGISAIVEDVIAAHLANPVVGARFQKVADIERSKRMASEFFSAGAGGPQKYTGRDMRTAHRGMNVSEAEFAAVVADIVTVLDRRGIDRITQKDVLSILDGLKGEIVGK